jgi:hypothetical protein
MILKRYHKNRNSEVQRIGKKFVPSLHNESNFMKTMLPSSCRLRDRVIDAVETVSIYLFALILVAVLVGCGGGGESASGGSPSPAPSIAAFSSDRATYFVGDQPTVTATFSGGSGRIVNTAASNISMPIISGTPLQLPKLNGLTTYRLIVETASQSVNRDLELIVVLRGRYLPVADRLGASGHDAVAMPDGGAVITGGSRGEGVTSNAIERFDPITNRIVRVGSLLTGRERHLLALLNNGDLLVVGGQIALTTASNAELISSATWQSTALPQMTTPRTEHTATTLSDGLVLITGGITAEHRYSPTAEIFDPATRTFRRLATNMASGRTSHTAIRLKDGRVLLVGGYSNSNYVFAELFVPSTESFVPVASNTTMPRANVAVEQLADGSVYIAGGDGVDLQSSSQVLRFDPATNSITTVTTTLPSPISLSRSVVLPDGRMALFGGIADAELNPVRNAFAIGARAAANDVAVSTLPLLPDPRVLHTATRLKDGRTLIVGGQLGFNYASTPYLFD